MKKYQILMLIIIEKNLMNKLKIQKVLMLAIYIYTMLKKQIIYQKINEN